MTKARTWVRHFLRWAILVLIILFIAWGCYILSAKEQPWPKWIGFEQTTLWNLFELLIIPATLAGGALWFSEQRNKTEREIAIDHSREAAFQAYLDDMTELLLEKELRTSNPDSDVREIARARTLTVLRGLDGKRKGILVRFLYQSTLIAKENLVIDLSGADLNGAELSGNDISGNRDRTFISYLSLSDVQLFGTNLREADLTEAKLSSASLVMADLSNANLTDAHLMCADLRCATLTGSNLKNTNLAGANLSSTTGVTEEQLSQAKSLKGATMPDGTQLD